MDDTTSFVMIVNKTQYPPYKTRLNEVISIVNGFDYCLLIYSHSLSPLYKKQDGFIIFIRDVSTYNYTVKHHQNPTTHNKSQISANHYEFATILSSIHV